MYVNCTKTLHNLHSNCKYHVTYPRLHQKLFSCPPTPYAYPSQLLIAYMPFFYPHRTFRHFAISETPLSRLRAIGSSHWKTSPLAVTPLPSIAPAWLYGACNTEAHDRVPTRPWSLPPLTLISSRLKQITF